MVTLAGLVRLRLMFLTRETSTRPVSVQKLTMSAWKLGLNCFGFCWRAQRGGASLEEMGCGPSHRGWNAHPPLLCTPPQSVCVARQRRPHSFRRTDSKGNFISSIRHPSRKEGVRNQAAASSSLSRWVSLLSLRGLAWKSLPTEDSCGAPGRRLLDFSGLTAGPRCGGDQHGFHSSLSAFCQSPAGKAIV